ncbi:MAG TPA: phosphatase PAP2 family protein [Ilumatobacter sp.]
MSARREVAIGLGSYALYLAVRRTVWTDRGRARALANARRVADVEHRLGVDVEAAVQRRALRVPGLVYGLNAGYAAGNVALSVGWLLRLYADGDRSFRRERRAAVAAFTGALPLFALFPVAPPRKLDDFVDTMGGEHTGLDHPFLTRWYNPIAAMPSHHMAFAVVTGVGLARRARTRRGRLGWLAYPGAVATVVIATANHFVADVVAGAALGGIARRLTR